MVNFGETTRSVELPHGVTLRVPGFRGTATARSGELASELRDAEPPVAEPTVAEHPALQAALARQELSLSTQVEIQLDPRSSGAKAVARGRESGEIEMEVPAPADDEIQVVLAEQDGVLSWHFSEPSSAGVRARAKTNTDLFVIPNRIGYTPVAAESEKQRGVIGEIGKKILKVFVYKVTDPIVGNISDRIAAGYEKKNRPYGLRMVTPDNYARPETQSERWPVDWNLLTKGKALLLIHGTFSTAHGAFGGLDRGTVQTLYNRYEGRLFAFNHFTISDDPKANVEWLAQQLPAGKKLKLDILCHSRGGLVARCICENPQSLGAHHSDLTVDRIVMVGVPNEGTVLADPNNLTSFLDRITNIVGLIPAGSGPLALVGEFLDGVLTIVKILGHGALAGLPGLASMDPDGGYLGTANQLSAKTSTYYAIAADYDPPPGNFRDTITKGTENALIDSMFEKPNDLVVPTAGVYELSLGSAFPIPQQRILQFPKEMGVMHTTYFGEPDTRARLVSWLSGTAII